MYTTDPHAVCYAACCDARTYALDPHAVHNAAMRVRTLCILILFVTLPAVMRVRTRSELAEHTWPLNIRDKTWSLCTHSLSERT
jgi:hypothetical protein